MNFLDMLMGYGVGDDASPVTTPSGDLMALLTQGGETPAQSPMVPQGQGGLPPASPVDNSMMVPLMLLRAAAEVSQRRAPGQSRTNQTLTALYNSTLAGMDYKGQQEDRARATRKTQMEEAVTEQNLATSRQSAAQQAELHPLAVQAKRLGISEAELKTKIEQKRLDWADRLNQAQLERDQATTEAQKANASARVMQAEAALQKADLMARQLGLQSARLELDASRVAAANEARDRAMPKRWQDQNTGASGWTWMDNGKMYQQQDGMDRMTAMRQLEKQIAYEKEMASKHNIPFTSPTPTDIQKTLQQLTTPKIFVWDSGTWRPVDDRKVDATGAVQAGAPPKAGVDTRPVLPPDDAEFAKIMAQLKANPGAAVTRKSDGTSFVLHPDGKQIMIYKPEVHDKAKSAAGVDRNEPVAPNSKAEEIGRKLDMAKTEMSGMGNPPPARDKEALAAYRAKKEAKAKEIAKLQEEYAAAIGNVPAFYGK